MTGAPAVQVSALPTFAPRETTAPADRDRGASRTEERPAPSPGEPRRFVPSFRLPELPTGNGRDDGPRGAGSRDR